MSQSGIRRHLGTLTKNTTWYGFPTVWIYFCQWSCLGGSWLGISCRYNEMEKLIVQSLPVLHINVGFLGDPAKHDTPNEENSQQQHYCHINTVTIRWSLHGFDHVCNAVKCCWVLLKQSKSGLSIPAKYTHIYISYFTKYIMCIARYLILPSLDRRIV